MTVHMIEEKKKNEEQQVTEVRLVIKSDPMRYEGQRHKHPLGPGHGDARRVVLSASMTPTSKGPN